MTVFKEFRWEAAHSLPNLPPEHKCHRLHGHSYQMTVWVKGEMDWDKGWIIDYADVSRIVNEAVADRLDHQNINDFVTPSTCEVLARWVWRELIGPLPGLCKIELRETPTCGVTVAGRDFE